MKGRHPWLQEGGYDVRVGSSVAKVSPKAAAVAVVPETLSRTPDAEEEETLVVLDDEEMQTFAPSAALLDTGVFAMKIGLIGAPTGWATGLKQWLLDSAPVPRAQIDAEVFILGADVIRDMVFAEQVDVALFWFDKRHPDSFPTSAFWFGALIGTTQLIVVDQSGIADYEQIGKLASFYTKLLEEGAERLYAAYAGEKPKSSPKDHVMAAEKAKKK